MDPGSGAGFQIEDKIYQSTSMSDIYPEFERQLPQSAKEELLGQRGLVVWMYGLSGSGKSTIANAAEQALHQQGRYVTMLDGDNLRSGLNAGLGFSDDDRNENIRRAAELAKLLRHNGAIVLVSLITPQNKFRDQVREILGGEQASSLPKALLFLFGHSSYQPPICGGGLATPSAAQPAF